jgi:hypothetical protein
MTQFLPHSRVHIIVYLILGVISLFVGVVSTCTGVSWARGGSVIRRNEEPKEFWEDVVASYLIGVCFIGYYLYQVYRF